MPRVATTNLTSGEVSAVFLGRADVAKYPNACQRLENFLLTTTGMWSFRNGFALMGFPKFSDSPIKLRRFKFSDQQGNMVELGEGYARFWHTLGQVADPDTGVPVEVATPFPAAELGLLGYTQSADFLFVIHEQRGIFTIKRHSLTSWEFGVFPLKDGPYGRQNADPGLSLTLGAPTGADYPVAAAGFPTAPFGAGDEGRLIRVNDSGWKWLIVKTVVDPTHVIATSQSGTLTQQAYTDWRLGLYSSRLGWPKTGTIHEQRFVLAGPASLPDRIDGSAIAGFDDFAPRDPLTDDGAWAFAVGSQGVDRIINLSISNDLVLFTGGTTNRMAGDSTGIAITPTQVWQKPVSSDGAKAGIEPISVGPARVYVDKYGLNIRAITYDLRFQSYAPDNLTLLADHMAWLDPDSPGFQALAWQGNPLGTIWTVRGNGELAGAIYDPGQNVLGWHRHPMGVPSLDGVLGGAATADDGVIAAPACAAPVVESIDILVGPTHDELWAVVVRELPNRTLRTIERLGRPALWDTPHERQSWLDCNLSLRNTPSADLLPAAREGSGVSFMAANVTGGFAFTDAHVGQFLKQRYVAGRNIRGRAIYRTAIAKITARQSDTTVTADIAAPFPAAAPIKAGLWGLTVGRVTGLDHWEGLYVGSVSDGRVCALQQVVGGALDLELPGWEVSVGLPYVGTMVGVPIDTGPQPVSGQGQFARVDQIRCRVLNSLGGAFASVPETEAEEPEMRWEKMLNYSEGEAGPQAAPTPFTGFKRLWGRGDFTQEPTIAIRQTDPLPFNAQLVIVHAYAPHVQP